MLDELPAEKLRNVFDPKLITCETTEVMAPLTEIVGQERAVKALNFGLEIDEKGFNVYVAGQPGTGRTTSVRSFLESIAIDKPVPSDWCYVNNFTDPYKPNAINLPPGKGKEFQRDMKNFIEETRTGIPKAFESEEYAAKREEISKSLEQQRRELFTQINERAKKEDFVIQSTAIGVLIIPVIQGQPMTDQQFMALSSEVRGEIEKRRDSLRSELRNAMRQLRDVDRELSEKLRDLNKEVANYATEHFINNLMEKYMEFPEVTKYLKEAQNDILENIDQFIGKPIQPQTPIPMPWMKELPFRKYKVNVIVDNSDLKGSPVVMELNPLHHNIFGRIEKEAQFGTLTTDFTMIRGGSLHRANGGYLVLPAEDLLRNLFTYEGLKRAIQNGEIAIEEVGERLGYITTKSLRPETIPLKAKIVLIGNSRLYHLLYSLDVDFQELFKVKADFDTTMDRTEKNVVIYASFVCALCKKEKLKHLDNTGLAKLIEYSSRLAADQEKLSTRFGKVADIVREACFYATQEKIDYVSKKHIRKAIEEKIYRSNLIQDKIQEMIERGVFLIDTEGEVMGQINGLAVISLGDFAFGRPSRVTASIGLGREGLIDIEREAKLGGPIHTKGVMILGGYLTQKYAQDKPLSLTARLVFEQSYSGVEGDSASSTELYAILSALSELPIKQGFAVTGSVNQKGEVQAIGGVNEKIEGFFEVCKAKGFTGKQGVLIPESNVQNLMLKEEVVATVKAGKFHIYPVKTIDEGIEILTGVKAGKRQPEGIFEEETINSKVNKRLREMAEHLREFPEFVVGKTKNSLE